MNFIIESVNSITENTLVANKLWVFRKFSLSKDNVNLIICLNVPKECWLEFCSRSAIYPSNKTSHDVHWLGSWAALGISGLLQPRFVCVPGSQALEAYSDIEERNYIVFPRLFDSYRLYRDLLSALYTININKNMISMFNIVSGWMDLHDKLNLSFLDFQPSNYSFPPWWYLVWYGILSFSGEPLVSAR